jgi:hypothetical protein
LALQSFLEKFMVECSRWAKGLSVAIALLASVASAEVTSYSVKPSDTDPQIKTADNAHWIYINRDIIVDHADGQPKDRHELLLWLTGTGGKGHDAQGFANLAADQGYHVITLMYPDEVAANECDRDSDPKTFSEFRKAIIEGGHATYQNGHKEITIERADSVENRLIKLLQHLQETRAKEEWSQFLTSDGAIRWEAIAVGGHSQGGGHAAYIGVHHSVERVLCFGAPKDYNLKLKTPAPWYHDKRATPADRFFAFNHHQDGNSCPPEDMLLNMKALGMDAFGAPAEVDHDQPPYHHARILYTSYPVVTTTGPNAAEGILTAHVTPIQTKLADRWKDVWTYMLTEKVK